MHNRAIDLQEVAAVMQCDLFTQSLGLNCTLLLGPRKDEEVFPNPLLLAQEACINGPY